MGNITIYRPLFPIRKHISHNIILKALFFFMVFSRVFLSCYSEIISSIDYTQSSSYTIKYIYSCYNKKGEKSKIDSMIKILYQLLNSPLPHKKIDTMRTNEKKHIYNIRNNSNIEQCEI